MVMPSLPTVGVWIEHWPSWYDEPRADAIHVLSRFLTETAADRRVGSVTSSDGVDLQLMRLETCEVPGQAVFDAARDLERVVLHRINVSEALRRRNSHAATGYAGKKR